MSISHVVLHTSASADMREPGRPRVVDASAKAIDLWHRAKGWSGIGYHWVVRMDGTVEKGRSERECGAHVAGFNSRSIGICFSGHGDLQDLTLAQKESGAHLVADVLRRHGLVDDFMRNPKRVIGHREINDLIQAGVLEDEYRTYKTCPGTKVNCRDFRRLVITELTEGDGA